MSWRDVLEKLLAEPTYTADFGELHLDDKMKCFDANRTRLKELEREKKAAALAKLKEVEELQRIEYRVCILLLDSIIAGNFGPIIKRTAFSW